LNVKFNKNKSGGPELLQTDGRTWRS